MMLIIITIMVALLLVACPRGDDGIDDGVLCLTFDGESRTYEGSTTLKTGPVTLLFLNESEGLADLVIAKIIDDKT
jgi:hypothetical protein